MSTPTENQATVRSAGLIGLTSFAGAIVGFGLQLLVAYHFGAGQDTDAFFMAQSTSELLSKLLLGGSITAVFIPLFVERLNQQKRAEAWHLALNIIHLLGFAFIVAIAILALFARPFVEFIAPGFTPEATALTIQLLRVLLPSFLLLFLVDLAVAMLHSLRHFATPALLRIIAPATSIIFVAILAPSLGIYALALGVVTGSAIQLLTVILKLRKIGFSYRPVLAPRDPAIKKLLHLTYPFIISVLMTQGAGIVYRILVSELDTGSLSALKYAEKITQLLTIMFLNSVTMVVYPLLAQKASQKDMLGARDTIGSAIRLITFVTVPIIVLVSLLREPLITFLYQRGSFSAADAAQTSTALLFLVIGLTTNGISSVLGHATLALQQTRAAVAVSVASQAIAISLFVLLTPQLGVGGLALASSLVPLAIALLYFLYLTRFIPRLSTIFWHPTYLKTIALTGLLAGVTQVVRTTLPSLPLPAILQSFFQLVVPASIAGSLFLGLAYWWRIPEAQDVIAIGRQKMARLRAR